MKRKKKTRKKPAQKTGRKTAKSARKKPAKAAGKKLKAAAPRKRRGPVLPTTYFSPKAFANKRACVLGMGRSGLAAARLLHKKGCKVLVSDTRPHKELRPAAAKLPAGVQWEGKGHSDRILKCHFAVKSPGIPSHAPVLAKLKEAGIPVFSELEVALSFCPLKNIVAVTGTNGKTTVVHLLAAVCRAARRGVHVCGNMGVPLSSAAGKVKKSDTLILEVSSYQLEDSRWLRPAVAVILNITRDHIDHHGGMPQYIDAKARIFADQDRSQHCVFNADDGIVYNLARRSRARNLFFGAAASTRTAAWIEKGKIRCRMPGEKKAQTITFPPLPGEHNRYNALAVALAARARGIAPAAIQRGFKSFKGVEHRIEDCGRSGILRAINDSKSTNVDSTLAALRSLSEKEAGKVLLILGGLHKGGSYGPLRQLVERYAKAVLTIGSAAAKIEEDLQGASPVFPCVNLQTAVEVAYKIGHKGDILLLSPASASFDQFADFEERGRCFKDLVRKHGGRA
ncbi:MAG: UDP-N-acetylmuramoyl-L-alanine--D-glutamate ligase [Elusimicrobiota bacterium]